VYYIVHSTAAVKITVTSAKRSIFCPNNTKKTAASEKIGDNSALAPTLLVLGLFSYFENNPFKLGKVQD